MGARLWVGRHFNRESYSASKVISGRIALMFRF
jgi:hypothetical protein